jgi:hypothetical protein
MTAATLLIEIGKDRSRAHREAVAIGFRPDGVRVAPDQEEDGHDLEQQGDPASPGHIVQRVQPGQVAALPGDAGQQPVAQRHHDNRGHP